MNTPTSYEAAQSELAELLQQLQGADVAVDELSALVTRAKELIEWCQKRLRSTQEEVTSLLDELDHE